MQGNETSIQTQASSIILAISAVEVEDAQGNRVCIETDRFILSSGACLQQASLAQRFPERYS
jgi:hypothetical protein